MGSLPGVKVLYCKDLNHLPINVPYLLTFKLDGTYQYIGGTDHTVTLSCTNRSVTLTTKKVIVEKGWKFLTNIEASKKGFAVVKIDVDGTLKKTINFKFVDSKDLFRIFDYLRVISELTYIKTFSDAYSPSEYSGNYCMSAAERGLSELLKNDSDFYAVERNTHKRKNRISFSNLNADDRAARIKKNGYIHSELKFSTRDFAIKLNKSFETDKDGKKKDKGSIVTMRNATNVYQTFLKNIRKEVGYHIYYCSIADALHTMLLIIDYTDPCDAKYEMWDQHGLSSSKGKLENIANGVSGVGGINSQVQWLVRWIRGVKKTNGVANADSFYPKLTCTFYKIQSK